MEALAPYLMALLPTIGVGALFYFVMKAIIEADRRERVAQATWEHDHARDEKGHQAAPPANGADHSTH